MARKSAIVVDFSDVSESAGPVRVTPGDYIAMVKKVEMKTSKKNKPYLLWTLVGISGALKKKTLFHNTSLQSHALFSLRNTLLACKVDVPASKMQIDLRSLRGRKLGITVDDDEYQGRIKSVVVETWPFTVKGGKVVREALPTGDELYRADDELPEDLLDDDDDEDGFDDIEVEDELLDDEDL